MTSNTILCSLQDKPEPWAQVSPGQIVTIRGHLRRRDYSHPGWQFRIIDPKTNTAPMLNADELVKRIKGDPEMALKRLKGQHILLTGKIATAKLNDAGLRDFTFATDDPSVEVRVGINPGFQPLVTSAKPGDSIQIFGDISDIDPTKSPVVIKLSFCIPVTTPLPIAGVEYATDVATIEPQ